MTRTRPNAVAPLPLVDCVAKWKKKQAKRLAEARARREIANAERVIKPQKVPKRKREWAPTDAPPPVPPEPDDDDVWKCGSCTSIANHGWRWYAGRGEWGRLSVCESCRETNRNYYERNKKTILRNNAKPEHRARQAKLAKKPHRRETKNTSTAAWAATEEGVEKTQEGWDKRRERVAQNPGQRLKESLEAKLRAFLPKGRPCILRLYSKLDTVAALENHFLGQLDGAFTLFEYATKWRVYMRVPLKAYDTSDIMEVRKAFMPANLTWIEASASKASVKVDRKLLASVPREIWPKSWLV